MALDPRQIAAIILRDFHAGSSESIAPAWYCTGSSQLCMYNRGLNLAYLVPKVPYDYLWAATDGKEYYFSSCDSHLPGLDHSLIRSPGLLGLVAPARPGALEPKTWRGTLQNGIVTRRADDDFTGRAVVLVRERGSLLCDCGAEKCNTPHAKWCQTLEKPND